jgi:hypothetical protein
MADGWLRAVVDVFGRRPELQAVYGGQLREVDAVQTWMLFEPFDELRLLEGNFIDVGAFAHRPMPEVQFRSDVDGLEDWDFILSVSRSHQIAPVPVIASVYLERAPGRLTIAPNHHEDEEKVRAAAVRERLADPAFVEHAIRSMSRDAGELSAPGAVTANDSESLAVAIRNVAQRCGEHARLLAWGIEEDGWDVDQRLGALGVVGEWLVVGPDAGPLDHGRAFDVVLVGCSHPGGSVVELSTLLADGGVLLVHHPDPSLPERVAQTIGSWRPFGDEWWVGSNVTTDFADIVPIRALLRGMRRTSPLRRV